MVSMSLPLLVVGMPLMAWGFVPKPLVHQQLHSTQHSRMPSPDISSTKLGSTSFLLSDAGTASSSSNPLMTYFLETLIANGVPAVFTIVVIAFAASMFKRSRKDMDNEIDGDDPVSALYNDLYGDQQESNKMLPRFLGSRQQQQKQLPKNTGIPQQEFIKMTHLNRKFESYQFSITAATESKAKAAAAFRRSSWQRAMGKAMAGVEPATQQALQTLEQEFVKNGAKMVKAMTKLETEITKAAVDESMADMGMESVYQLDAAGSNTTVVLSKKKSNNTAKYQQELFQLQKSLQELELKFIKEVVQTVGPSHAAAVRSALLGDVAVRGSGNLLRELRDRPLVTLLQSKEDNGRSRLFVTRFPGDVSASQVAQLREEVTAIVRASKPGDEALVVLQSGGGTVTGYGLAAAQLLRFKEAGLKLTIAVEQVAASGGYMMCCVADKIIASPFAVLGSIGVITDIPNVYERLKQEGIEFQTVTAGKYKRTLTPTKKVTREDFEKTKADVENILVLFRDFVAQNRPQLEIDKVATGETWFGTDALQRKLCDEIKTVDAALVEYVDSGYDVYEVAYSPPVESPFGRLLPARAQEGMNSGSVIQRGIAWIVRAVVSEVQSAVGNGMTSTQSADRRYMAYDDQHEKIRSQD